MSDLSGKTAIVVGASRGLGHGIAVALPGPAPPSVSRTAFPETADGSIRLEVADAGEATVAAGLLTPPPSPPVTG